MYSRIVTFQTDGLTEAQYLEAAVHVAPRFTAWPGLLAKYWLADRERRAFGGVYVVEDEASADRSRATHESAVAADPAFVDVEVRELSTIGELDAITSPARLIASPS